MEIKKCWLKKYRKRVLMLVFLASIVVCGLHVARLYAQVNDTVVAITSTGKAADLLISKNLNGEETGRSNILIVGNSADDINHPGATLADSIMVVSIDIKSKKVSLVSIPRDLWVTADGYGFMKINAVYSVGGVELLQATVENIIGTTINHHVVVNYAAFKELINAAGGVDVLVDSVDSRGICDPNLGLLLANGIQHLDGATALMLARSRNVPTYDGREIYGLPNGDFDRMIYQRKIFKALLDKIVVSEVLTNQTKMIAILNSLKGNITSDFSVGQLRRSYDLAKVTSTFDSTSIKGEDINSLLVDYWSNDGQMALIPSIGMGNYIDIQSYVYSYFNSASDNSE